MKVKRLGPLAAALGLATLVAAVAFGVATTPAPAGNRDAAATFEAFPGPDEVTFGNNVSYRASLYNDPDLGTSTFTHIRFSMSRPVTTVGGISKYADLVYASCDTDGTWEGYTATAFSCPEVGQLQPGAAPIKLTIIWSTPTVPEGTVCGDGTTCQLTTTGTWTIKESNNTTPSPDTFTFTESTTLLVQPEAGKAGGYAYTACTDPSSPNVETYSKNLGLGNGIATAVCATSMPGTTLDPGLVIEIQETAGGSGGGFTDTSNICIPEPSDPGTDPCATGYTPWLFDEDDPAIFIFKIPENAYPNWPKGEKLDAAYHDNSTQPYTAFTCIFDRDGKTKIWTVTCPAIENGSWRFG